MLVQWMIYSFREHPPLTAKSLLHTSSHKVGAVSCTFVKVSTKNGKRGLIAVLDQPDIMSKSCLLSVLHHCAALHPLFPVVIGLRCRGGLQVLQLYYSCTVYTLHHQTMRLAPTDFEQVRQAAAFPPVSKLVSVRDSADIREVNIWMQWL